ncbi:MAG: diguanylate cyclase [Cyanobacteria bacterium P01_H01_bin.119]
MDELLLLVGENRFAADLVPRIQRHLKVEIITAETSDEIEHVFKEYSPNLLILQAYYPLSEEICQRLKQTRDLAWIYALVIHLQPIEAASDPDKQAIAAAQALNLGADAYLTLPALAPNHDEKTESPAEQRLQAQLMAAARRIKIHQDLVRANNVLSAIALSDALTQINNRRAFDWELPRLIKSAQEKNLELSLMVIDIDLFKQVNDTHGHLIGDQALRIIADRLRSNMRAYDTPYRYGGEEFVVILSHTGPKEAHMIGDRICRLISEHPFVISEALSLDLTVSVGVASLMTHDDSKGLSLIYRADQGLLAAKESGRNRVCFSDGSAA